MRIPVLTAAMLSIAGPVLASSITPLVENGAGTSIIEKTCSACDRSASREKPEDGAGIYHVPTLTNDIQTTEIRAINGEEKLVRTEAWLGGSPVTFISKVPAWMSPDQKAEAILPVRNGPVDTTEFVAAPAPDGIDNNPTSAVGDNAEAPGHFDDFSLRLK